MSGVKTVEIKACHSTGVGIDAHCRPPAFAKLEINKARDQAAYDRRTNTHYDHEDRRRKISDVVKTNARSARSETDCCQAIDLLLVLDLIDKSVRG